MSRQGPEVVTGCRELPARALPDLLHPRPRNIRYELKDALDRFEDPPGTRVGGVCMALTYKPECITRTRRLKHGNDPGVHVGKGRPVKAKYRQVTLRVPRSWQVPCIPYNLRGLRASSRAAFGPCAPRHVAPDFERELRSYRPAVPLPDLLGNDDLALRREPNRKRLRAQSDLLVSAPVRRRYDKDSACCRVHHRRFRDWIRGTTTAGKRRGRVWQRAPGREATSQNQESGPRERPSPAAAASPLPSG
ncbi:MAG: hypothetical protein QOH06_5205 [Acidobacteriota bacterium]|nr:hypothetical protein [Acidobacteriota bacterium]